MKFVCVTPAHEAGFVGESNRLHDPLPTASALGALDIQASRPGRKSKCDHSVAARGGNGERIVPPDRVSPPSHVDTSALFPADEDLRIRAAPETTWAAKDGRTWIRVHSLAPSRSSQRNDKWRSDIGTSSRGSSSSAFTRSFRPRESTALVPEHLKPRGNSAAKPEKAN